MKIIADRGYDAIPSIALGIPKTAKYVFYYVDSVHYTWPEALRLAFPGAVKIGISTTGSNAGLVGDCETGDMTPASVVSWVRKRRTAGVNAGVYCNMSTWPSVLDAFDEAKMTQPWYWIAKYDGNPNTMPIVHGVTAVAKQYADPPKSGGTYDISALTDIFVSIVAPHLAPTPPAEPTMELTDKLDPNAPQGTVNEALNAVLAGIGGVRSAGPLALNVANVLRAVNAANAHLATLDGTLSVNQAAVLAAITTAEQHGGASLSPDQISMLATQINAGLAAIPTAVRRELAQAWLAYDKGAPTS